MANTYEDRMRRVIQHIFDNPAGDLSLDALADVAAMSRFHWHRVYHAMTGETCAQAVRRVRAHRAACWLVQSDWPIEVIATKAGYDNTQSFARLFRKRFGMTPAAFRAAGRAGHPDFELRKGPRHMFPVEIKELPERRLAALRHTGAYPESGRAYEQVAAVFSANNLWPQARGMVGVYYDDPESTPEADLTADCGVEVAEAFEMPEALSDVRLTGGSYAVLMFKGPYSGLKSAYDYLYGPWLAETGKDPADAPSYERYLNSPTDTAPADLVTEICMPLAKGGTA
ncbi:MAG: AraC family transcriptional regulator [Pelagimonas sp.]|uniref:AraC family transcriptional regulator n=1 Tax=Pelagimonas sp. TaxID=2073170 RepID=UPI003D6AF902